MPEDKPVGIVTNTPVMTGRTLEVQGKQESMNSPMMSPNMRKDQIKSQALQTLRGIAGNSPGGPLSKFGPQDKKVIKMEKVDKEEETKEVNAKPDAKVAKATAQLKKLGI